VKWTTWRGGELQKKPGGIAKLEQEIAGRCIQCAAQGWYVLESLVSPCCSPSVLTFASRFAGSFNGKLADFSQARQHNHN
jgi:hypothetical protein